MSSEDLEHLHNIWIKFLNTKNTKEGESWLDAFLARYLTLFCYNEIPPNHEFCFQYKYSANVLVHQLLTDVFQLCEDIEKESSSLENENEVSAKYFRNYLLEGRGWKILWTLDKIGVQHLMHLKELIVVLISQMPVLLTLPVYSSVIPECLERKPKHLDLNSCFFLSNKQTSMSKCVDLRKPEVYVFLKRNFHGKKRAHRKRTKSVAKSSSSSSEEQDVMIDHCFIPASQLKSLLKVKTGTNNTDNSSDSSESSHFIHSDSSVASNVNDFQSYSISVIDYIAFNLNIFQECVLLDAKFKDIKACTSPTVLEFSFRLLKEMHTDKHKFSGWSVEAIQDLKTRLLELLFLSSSVTRVAFGYDDSPNASEIIFSLFIISEEILNLPHRHTLHVNDILFVSHILKGCLMSMLNVIETCNGDYAKIICITRTFSDHGDMCCNLFPLLEKQITVDCENELKTIISLVRDIVTTLKILRISATYSSFDKCDIKDYIHHHHDILGPPVSHNIINKDPMCCVATMSCLLLKFFNISLCPKTSNDILKHLKMSGICCCVSPSFMLKTLFDGYATRDSETQKLVLIILGKHLFPQLGLVSKCQKRCSCCSKYLNTSEFSSVDRTLGHILPGKDMQMLQSNIGNRDSFNLIFKIYNDLLNLTEGETLENISRHLIEIFSISVDEFKIQIFIRVIFPQLLNLKIKSNESSSSVIRIKVKCFLSVLPHILPNTSLYSVFVKLKGIPVIFSFLLHAEFRDLALNVIKFLIYSENEYGKTVDKDSELCSYPSCRIFCNFLSDQTETFIQKLNLVLKLSSTYIELITTELETAEKNESTFTVIDEFPCNVTFICDIWSLFNELVLNNKLIPVGNKFKEILTSGYNLLILLLKNLAAVLSLKIIVENQKIEKILLLLQNLILILVNQEKEIHDKKSVLDVLKHNLKIHASSCIKHQKMLFCLILKCSFWSSNVAAPVRGLDEVDIYLEKEILDSLSSSDKDDTEASANGDSYAADSEGSRGSTAAEVNKDRLHCENFIKHGEFVKMLCELVADLQVENSVEWMSTALYFMNILIKLCQDCLQNKSVLCNHEIPPLLLGIFANSLICSQKNMKEFQTATMDLFVILTESAMKVDYIKRMIDFFKISNSPVDILLKSFNKMVDQITHSATRYITFPCAKKSSSAHLRVKKRLKTIYTVYKQYELLENVTSAWTSASIVFPLTEDTKWNAVNKGFNITLSLRLNQTSNACQTENNSGNSFEFNKDYPSLNSSEKSPLLHILSLGSEKLLIEFWCQAFNGDLVVRISSYVNGNIICLAEGTCSLLFQFNIWHHVAIFYSEEVEKSVVTSKIHIIVDGFRERNCFLKYQRPTKSLNKCHLLLGDCAPALQKTFPDASYSIANVCLFKDNVFTKDILCYLSNCGPDISGITRCAIERPVKFVLKNNYFQSMLSPSNLDIIIGNKIPNLDHLQNAILCSFDAKNPNVYLVYPGTPRGFFPLHFPVRGKSRLSGFEEWPYQKQPLEFPSLLLASVHSYQYCGFEYAVQNAGGIRIFLFLFANVLENFASEENLLAALNIILKLLNKSMTFVEDFTRIKGYELLIQMIANTKCCISGDYLQVFIQNCMVYPYPDKEIFPNCELSSVENLTVIRNTSIFKLMFRSLAFAPQAPPSVTTGLFSVLDLLLNPKHSNLNINVEQLMSIEILNILMWLLKRNIILFDKNYLPPAVIKMIPIIIDSLLMYKFDIGIMKNTIYMLLLLHNASSTYVCHSPSAFFFLTPRDKSAGSTASSLMKTSLLYAGNDVNDAFNPPRVSTLRRTSSFSGPCVSKEKEDLKKSKSLNQLTPDLLSDSDGMDWKSDVFCDFSFDETDKIGHLKFGASSEMSFNQNKSAELTIGLLKLIYNFITSENESYSQPLLEIIKPEIFIVLAYTENSEICAAVIKVINAYLKASDEDKQKEFLTMKGFHLLANQLYQSAADREVIDACFSMIFNCSLSAVDMFAMCEKMNAPSFQVLSWIPVLALLPNTYSDEELCENIITVLSKFLHLGTNIIIELLENGLVVSLINLILKFCFSAQLTSDESFLDRNPVVKKVGHLLKYIAEDLCSSKISKGFISFVDALQMFSAWEKICCDKYGPESLCVTSLRNCQCMMFEIVVDFSELYNLSNQDPPNFLDEPSVWDVVIGLQSTFGSFTPIAVPQSLFSVQTPIHSAVEAKELDRPLSAEVEKCVNEVPINDIIERFLLLIEAAADFFVFKDHNVKIGFAEKEFFKTFFKFIVENITLTLDKNLKFVKSKNTAVLFALRDMLKKQLGRILVSSITPSQDIYIKSSVIEILSMHPLVSKILQYAVYSIAKVGAFLVFLYDLQANPVTKFQKQCFLIFSIVKHLLENSQYISILYNKETIEKVKTSWLSLWNEDRCKWLTICAKKNEKTFQKMEFLAQDVSTMALYVTQQIFEIQNMERKLLIEELKIKYYEEACERMTWLELCEQMTHERAIWHMKDYYPFSWEIDPTEGPARVRKRLRRCHIQMHPRFFRPDYADALSNLKNGAPFVNLLMHQNEYPDSAVVLHRLFRDEQIKFTCPCMIVTAFEEIAIEILIGAYCIHIIGENTSSQYASSPISESWTFDSIREIIPRRHELLNNAFEIFLTNGMTYMIAFHTEKDFNIVWKQLQSQGLPCENNNDPLVITQLWRDGTITNYEYLVCLNKLAGRTFNDLMQYPVFPFILADYVSFFLNLKDPASFRNLSKPIAVQLERKEEYYRNMYKVSEEDIPEDLCKALSEQAEFDSSLPYIGPYHYGSHYSNSGTVLHFLIRLLPYTYGFISYQDRNFDCADRTFHNLNTSWELVTEKSSSDVKELIPEFFFLPEFLCNSNGFDFGVTQGGIRVNDVILPPWCKQDARLFILIHRQALESEIVSNNLHGWIDLIFGCKQTGEAAVNAINVFHPSTYFGLDRNRYSDPLRRDAFRTMIRTLGNTPQQLFSNPHPMVSLSLANLDSMDEMESLIEVVDTVQGLRWGSYVGSPSTRTPSLVWCRKQSIVLGSFLTLLTNYVFGLGENICLLLNHRQDSGSGISRATYIMSAALVSWNHSDGIVRIKLCRDQPSLPLLRGSSLDPICLCASVPDCIYLFVAHSSGIIEAYNLELNASELIIKEKQPRIQLNGHSAAVTSICICKAFSIVASASLDKTVIIWDLNKLCYVRTLSCHEGAVSLVCVSDTLGDVASVCTAENNAGSFLKVHTINGDIVGTVKLVENITAVCYSTAPEGMSVNVIATGLDNGIIHLYSSWDLKLVRVISCDRFTLPIRCISFSADNQHLYASNEDGTVTVWEKPSRGLTSVPRLLVFT